MSISTNAEAKEYIQTFDAVLPQQYMALRSYFVNSPRIVIIQLTCRGSSLTVKTILIGTSPGLDVRLRCLINSNAV